MCQWDCHYDLATYNYNFGLLGRYLTNSCPRIEFIKTEILDYWLNNEGSMSNPAMEWDVFKAGIRGRLIQHCSYQ